MSLGHAEVIKSDYDKAYQQKLAKIRRAYEAARHVADQGVKAAPRDTGALIDSSWAKALENGIGFVMRSFGNEDTGKAYAKFVNSGHHIVKKDGSTVFVPAVPYFSQAESDARAVLLERLTNAR